MPKTSYQLDSITVTKEELLYYFLILHSIANCDEKYKPKQQSYYMSEIMKFPTLSHEIHTFVAPFHKNLQMAKHKISSFILANTNDPYKSHLLDSLKQMALSEGQYTAAEKAFVEYIRKVSGIRIENLSLEQLNDICIQDFNGKILVSEIFNETNEERMSQNVCDTIKNSNHTLIELIQKYPFLMIRILCWFTLRQYKNDQELPLYDQLLQSFSISQPDFDPSEIGKLFLQIIDNHPTLMTFEDEIPVDRSVEIHNIFMHAGLPSSAFKDFFSALYKATQQSHLSLEELLNGQYLNEVTHLYFKNGKEFSKKLFDQTLKMFFYQNTSSLNLPLSLIRVFLVWKNKNRKQYEYLKKHLSFCQNQNLHFYLDHTSKIGIRFSDLRILRAKKPQVQIQIVGHDAEARYIDCQFKGFDEQDFSYGIIEDQKVLLTADEIQALLKHNTLKLTAQGMPLGYISLFKSNQYQIAVFEERVDLYFKHRKDHNPLLASVLLIPADYNVQISSGSDLEEIQHTFYSTIFLYQPKDLDAIHITNSAEKPLAFETFEKFEFNRINAPVPHLYYKQFFVYSGQETDFSISPSILKNMVIEKKHSGIIEKVNTINHYGEYLINSDDSILCIPLLDISLDRDRCLITIESQDEQLHFENNRKTISASYFPGEPFFHFTVYLNNIPYRLVYELPRILWDIKPNLQFLDVQNQTILELKESLQGMLLIRTINLGLNPQTALGEFSLIISPKKIGYYYVSLSTVRSIEKELSCGSHFLYIKIGEKKHPLILFTTLWRLIHPRAGVNEQMIKIVWDGLSLQGRITGIRLWNYYRPFDPPIYYSIDSENLVKMKNPGYEKVLIEWVTENHQNSIFSKHKKIVMPLYALKQIESLPQPLQDKFFYDHTYGCYIRNGILNDAQYELLSQHTATHLFCNYFIYINDKTIPDDFGATIFEKVIANCSAATIDTLFNMAHFLQYNGFKDWIDKIDQALESAHCGLLMYQKLKQTLIPNRLLALFQAKIPAQNPHLFWFKKCFLIPKENRAEYFKRFYLTQFSESRKAIEYFLMNTNQLFSSSVYQEIMSFYLQNFRQFTEEAALQEIKNRVSLHTLNLQTKENAESYFKLLETTPTFKEHNLFSDPTIFLDQVFIESLVAFSNYLQKTNIIDFSHYKASFTQRDSFFKTFTFQLRSIRCLNVKYESLFQTISSQFEQFIQENEQGFITLLEQICNIREISRLKELIDAYLLKEGTIYQKLVLLMFLSDRYAFMTGAVFLSDFETNNCFSSDTHFDMRDPIINNYIRFFCNDSCRRLLMSQDNEQVLAAAKPVSALILQAIKRYEELINQYKTISPPLYKKLTALCQNLQKR